MKLYNEAVWQYPLLEIIAFPGKIHWFIFFRMISASFICTGIFPNFFKWIYLAAAILEYNQNVLYKNNHFYLEIWIASLALLPELPLNKYFFSVAYYKRKNSTTKYLGEKLKVPFHRARAVKETVFWFCLKVLISVVYLFASIVKVTLYEVTFIQGLGLVADISLLTLTLFHKRFRLTLIALAILFHMGTLRFNIGIFPYLMMALVTIVYLPPDGYVSDLFWGSEKETRAGGAFFNNLKI